ncbi:MAG: NADH-quinone oxidoreductase subunit J [Desulfobacterales bacterium]|nr:MAG: NADH-quinone oxidoreductase subunit J [Desulfobacterales bacterium]
MTIYSIIFYVLAAVILVATALAITRRNLVHAVVYLILSFFGSALMFYLLGAPLLAALEVIIYAGAIMILFLFIIMMLKGESLEERMFPPRQWLPAAIMGLIYLAIVTLFVFTEPGSQVSLKIALAKPRDFGRYLFTKHWLSIEIVSLLLLIALLGALYMGRRSGKKSTQATED